MEIVPVSSLDELGSGSPILLIYKKEKETLQMRQILTHKVESERVKQRAIDARQVGLMKHRYGRGRLLGSLNSYK